ncbi:hypothetical protein ONS95_011907 [Cadophora gregata]|uniref:uncharacterized protein n=1 Tax=Cadophora gregata TaxID=51156 RepID=UPI0026DB2640|nr:uncharacterized protein ONS95_011907 [Cadophora gregata]KAK0117571.1 hypothetical protein ONS95_011907 [Cadophora gregata]KAK0122622.1 hypothetical protein ONS96_009662 [Cadophora gregata f. sp. sojae]
MDPSGPFSGENLNLSPVKTPTSIMASAAGNPPPTRDPTLQELQAAASEVVEILKTVPGIAGCRIAVNGGLALWSNLPQGRNTKDVDFVISLDTAPYAVKKTLLSLHPARFEQEAHVFYYQLPNAPLIQVDMCPSWMLRYPPVFFPIINQIPAGVVSYISPTELLTYKIYSCGLRADNAKRGVDAVDALTLSQCITPARMPIW